MLKFSTAAARPKFVAIIAHRAVSCAELARVLCRPSAPPCLSRPSPSRSDADQAEAQVVEIAEILLVLLDGGIGLVGVLEVVGGVDQAVRLRLRSLRQRADSVILRCENRWGKWSIKIASAAARPHNLSSKKSLRPLRGHNLSFLYIIFRI